MKKTLAATISLILISGITQAAPIFTENFNSYTNGPLLGQGTPPWALVSSTVNPISVTDGSVSLTTSGQDVGASFDTHTGTDGTSLFFGMSINLSAAQATGDYFAHLTPNSTSLFYARLFAQSTEGGFLLGYLETSGSGGAVTYGTTVLSFDTDYRVAVAYDFVAGALNDTARVYVDPVSGIELDNPVYLSDTWTSVSAEPSVFGTVNLRQGTSGSAATMTIDDIVVSTAFADVAMIPEPSTYALLGLGGLGVLLRRRFARK